MKNHIVVAGYAFYENKVFLIHHKKLNKWLPPGGHIENDETPDSALEREFKEETGLKINILNKKEVQKKGNITKQLAVPFYVNVHSVGDHEHTCLFYICEIQKPANPKTNDELLGCRFFSKEDMINSNLEGDVKNIGLLAFDFIEKIKIKSIAVSELVELIIEQAKKKGFGTKSADIDIAEKIALIHSEVSEAYEAYRHKDMNEFKEELGDIVQRVLHLCGIFDIDIEKEIVKKIESNKSRNWRWNEMNEKHS